MRQLVLFKRVKNEYKISINNIKVLAKAEN